MRIHPPAAVLLALACALPARAAFTRLILLPAPAIVAAAPAVSGNGSPLGNVDDGDPRTEYASSEGTGTFVEFDFGHDVRLAAFRHQDRASATIRESELTFFDAAGRRLGRRTIRHRDQPGAIVVAPLDSTLAVRRVRWQVTRLGAAGQRAVGAAEIAFYAAGPAETAPRALTLAPVAVPVATRGAGGAVTELLRVAVDYPYAEGTDATLSVGDQRQAVRLVAGPQEFTFPIPAETVARRWDVAARAPDGVVLAQADATAPPFRPLTIYVLPHSHVDIGYTQIQTDIEEKQVNNLFLGMAAAERTAGNPAGARFVWNLEGLWAADLLLHRYGEPQRRAFLAAVRSGRVALNGMYFNTLTGLCRPEDLLQLFRYATQLRAETGATLDTAMISDVPGCTWGIVTAMAQAGLRYFSVGPNHFDRIGSLVVSWENKPFWWESPSGRERVLVWMPSFGYGLSHGIHHFSAAWVEGYAEELAREHYPYDLGYVRWVGEGDNGAPDPGICDFIRDWNATHVSPRLEIASAHDAFHALDERFGDRLPVLRGDLTPYWEDGAASSARETALTRTSADRLAQASALWALRSPATFPSADFAAAEKQVLLYDEHTWGASGSVTAPRSRETIEQWGIKQGYADTADIETRALLGRALAQAAKPGPAVSGVDIVNTSAWVRSGLAVLAKDFAAAGSRVTDLRGAAVPAQRLTGGPLAVWAQDVPAGGTVRYRIGAGDPAAPPQPVTVTGTTLDNGRVRVAIDPDTGNVTELRRAGAAANVAGAAHGAQLNTYLYFNGSDPRSARTSGAPTVRIREKGPLVASLLITSSAPGCFALEREVTLVAGQDSVELSDLVDKSRIVADDYRAAEAKESVNFAFAFSVPHGQVRLEEPLSIVRPDADQLPGANKNWYPVNRWADVSNDTDGVTWISLDAPLLQVGGLTANLLNSQTNPALWRRHVGETQALYAWVMNNHWGTNYRAWQEGPVRFRFVLRPHGPYEPAAATRIALEAAQPLLAVRARGPAPDERAGIAFASPDVVVTGLKPSDDGRALMVCVWNPTAHAAPLTAAWGRSVPLRLTLSDTAESRGRPVAAGGELPPGGFLTLRAELP